MLHVWSMSKSPKTSDSNRLTLLGRLSSSPPCNPQAGLGTFVLGVLCLRGAFMRYSEEELRPYFTVPFEARVGTNPPRFSIDFDKIYDADKAKAEIEAERAEFSRRLEANRGSASPA